MFTTELGLTTDQQTEVKAIFEVMHLKMEAIMEDATLSKEVKMAKMKELRTSTDAAIRAILTADQQTKFDELQKKRQHGPGGHRHGRPPGPPPSE
jgi:periplasmic protein CpxP/Spy